MLSRNIKRAPASLIPTSSFVMHAFQLEQTIDSFFGDLESYRPFFDLIESFSRYARKLDEPLSVLGKSIDANAVNRLHATLATTRQAFTDKTQRQIFQSIDAFERGVAQFRAFAEDGIADKLIQQVSVFADLYSTYLSSPSGSAAVPLLQSAPQMRVRVDTFLLSLSLIRGVTTDETLGSAEATLSLWLPGQLTLQAFIGKLAALESVYAELCMLFKVSEETFPLRISKIESGSLLAKVIGESRVIGLMIELIKKAADWTYRNYTKEGRLTLMDRQVAAVEQLLGLKHQMENAGIDTKELQAHIEKSSILVGKGLVKILDGEDHVTVNDQYLPVQERKDPTLVGGYAQRKLPRP